MPRISIIIPVYNVEHDIRKCLDSIVAQTFCDYECLLIDDGSTDKSSVICDEYAEKDNRFKVYHQQNSGVSVARNLGLNNAKGEYVAFIDSDDYISDNYLSIINECDKDIILLENKHVSQDGKVLNYFYIEPQILNDKEEIRRFLAQYLAHPIMKVVWAKLIRKAVIGGIRYNVRQTIGEDTVFMFDVLRNCGSIGAFSGYTYFWLYNGGDFHKYKQIPKVSAEYASNIYQSYKHLNVISVELVFTIISFFYMLCDKKCNYTYLKPWFCNEDIRKMNSFLLNNCPERLSEEYKFFLKPIYVQLVFKIKYRLGYFLRKLLCSIRKKQE